MEETTIYTSDMEELELLNELSSLRRYNRISQQDVGDISGVSKSNISRFEKNVHSPTLRTLSKYIDALGYDFKIVLIER